MINNLLNAISKIEVKNFNANTEYNNVLDIKNYIATTFREDFNKRLLELNN